MEVSYELLMGFSLQRSSNRLHTDDTHAIRHAQGNMCMHAHDAPYRARHDALRDDQKHQGLPAMRECGLTALALRDFEACIWYSV